MVRYSDWIQDPDYVRVAGGIFGSDPDAGTGDDTGGVASYTYATQTIDGARPPASQGVIDEVVTATDQAGWTKVPRSGPLSVSYDFTGGVFGPWSTIYRASRIYGLLTWSAHTRQSNVYRPDPLPPDVVGIEWEPSASIYDPGWNYYAYSTVVAAEWDMPSRSYNLDSTINGPVNGAWHTEVRAVDGVTFASQGGEYTYYGDNPRDWNRDVAGAVVKVLPQAPHQESRTDHLDLTPHLYGPPESGYLSLVEVVIGSATVADPSREGGYVIGSLYSNLGGVAYTLRPPRYRYIYEGSESTVVPPLRQYPRDDALGAGSASRMFSSSQQNSLRQVGYY